MEIFRKGSDPPPPPYFWKLLNPWGKIQFWSQKGKKLNFPKTSKMAIFNINLLGKVLKSTQNSLFSSKLDRVGPVDNRPSTDKLYHYVWRKKSDMWHMTRDMWHMTCDMWHMTCDMLWGVNILSKFQLPSSHCLWFMILWRSGGKGWMTELIN